MSDGATRRGRGTPRGPDRRDGDRPPLLPDWDGPCIHRVVPTLLAHLARPGEAPLPPWFPAPVAEARQIVLLVLDGLGAEQLRERSGLAPVLAVGRGQADHDGRAQHDGVRPHDAW